MKRILPALAVLCGCGEAAVNEGEHMNQDNETLAFFESLDYDSGLEVAVKTFERFPLQYAATAGLDGIAQVRPVEFKFEEDGVLYFDTVEFYTSYKEMQAVPYIQVCVCDQETMTYVRLSGKVNFTKDGDIVNRCIEASPVLKSQFGDHPEYIVAYYLTEVTCEFATFLPELENRTYKLPNKFDEN